MSKLNLVRFNTYEVTLSSIWKNIHTWTEEGEGSYLSSDLITPDTRTFRITEDTTSPEFKAQVLLLIENTICSRVPDSYVSVCDSNLSFNRLEDLEGTEDPNGAYIVDYAFSLSINGTLMEEEDLTAIFGGEGA